VRARRSSSVSASRGGGTPNNAVGNEIRKVRGSHSAKRAAAHRKNITQILNMHQGGGENNENNNNHNSNKFYTKTSYTNAKQWMERRLSKFKSGIPKDDASILAQEWVDALDAGDIDHRIIEIEAAQIAKRYNRFHVSRLGDMSEERPDGVLRLLFGQLNSASTEDVRDRKVAQINQVVDKWDVQGGGLLEVGVNWSSWPSSYSFASWFLSERETRSSVAWNKNKGENISRRQQGGVALFACKELLGYKKEANHDFRDLGRWNSWRIYSNPNHVTRIISAYFTGKQRSKLEGSIYQQQLRYIQENELDTTPRDLFLADFIAQLRTWRSQGERLLIHLDMNEPILQGELGQRLLSSNLDLEEASHHHWGANEPNTFIGGRRAIDGCFTQKIWKLMPYQFYPFTKVLVITGPFLSTYLHCQRLANSSTK